MTRALLVIDMEKDFSETGSLPTYPATKVATEINRLLRDRRDYDFVLASKDWHRDPGNHWSETPDFVTSFPRHCEAGLDGSRFIPELVADGVEFDAIFYKGEHGASFSAFEGITSDGETLGEWLIDREVTEIHGCGTALEFCVKSSLIDSVNFGYDTTLLANLTAAVDTDPRAVARQLDEYRSARIKVEQT